MLHAGVQPATASQRLVLSAAGAGVQITQIPGPEFYPMEWALNGPKSDLEVGLVPGGKVKTQSRTTDMTDNVFRTTAATILKMSITDEPWVDVGYGKRPKHGNLFQHFRPKWRRDFEDSLLREIVGIFTAAYLLAGVVRQTDLDMVIDLYVDGNTGDLFRTFGFLSRTDALSYFSDAIREYHEAGPSEWASILARRIGITHLPDRGLSARLLAGSGRFVMSVEAMVFVLRRQE